MFCTKCGQQLEDNAKFCIKCGNPVNVNDKLAQTKSLNNPEFSSSESKTLTKEKKDSLKEKSAIIATLITLPLCLVIGILADSLGFNNIIALPVFVICFPLLWSSFYKRFKHNIQK